MKSVLLHNPVLHPFSVLHLQREELVLGWTLNLFTLLVEEVGLREVLLESLDFLFKIVFSDNLEYPV